MRRSGKGYRPMNYAIKKAEELFPHAELLIDDAPVSLFLDELRDLCTRRLG